MGELDAAARRLDRLPDSLAHRQLRALTIRARRVNRLQHSGAHTDHVDVTSPERSRHARLSVVALVLALLGAVTLVVDGLAALPSPIFAAAFGCHTWRGRRHGLVRLPGCTDGRPWTLGVSGCTAQ